MQSYAYRGAALSDPNARIPVLKQTCGTWTDLCGSVFFADRNRNKS